MMFTHAITHQKHLAQSRRSKQSAVDIFNTLRIFTKEHINIANKSYIRSHRRMSTKHTTFLAYLI